VAGVLVSATVAQLLLSSGAALGKPDEADGTASVVEIRPVLLEPEMVPPVAPSDEAAVASVASCDPAAVAALSGVATSAPSADAADECVIVAGTDGDERYYLGAAAVTADSFRKARAHFQRGMGWTVEGKLTDKGSKAFDDLARRQFRESVGIVVDGTVVSAPVIQPDATKFTSFDGAIAISRGGVTELDKRGARELARDINASARLDTKTGER